MDHNRLSQLLQFVVEASPQASLVVGPTGVVRHSNRKSAELLNCGIGQIVDRPVSELLDLGDNWDKEGRIEAASAISGKSFTIDVECLGTPQEPVGFAYYLESTEGTLAKAVSDREQKLASIGTLAGEISHDLNNVLTGILGHISFLRISIEEDSEFYESVIAVEKGAKQAAKMTQRILQFARGQAGDFAAVNFSALLEASVGLMRAALPKNITFTVDAETDESLFVWGDESALSQLLINLIVNARDAQPQGGKIVMTLKDIHLGSSPANVRPTLKPGDYLALQVEDEGVGIEPNLIEKIFEPFFTTKSDKGTGLGLATVSSVVQRHGGGIAVESTLKTDSKPGGTQFFVFLPRSSEPTGSYVIPKDTGSKPSQNGSERILIVDDEEGVRTVVEKSLELLGYDVAVACGGKEAIQIFSENPQSFSLAILDMMMPEMSGDELFDKLREIRPDIGVLIASGYASDAKTRRVLDNGGLGFIQKPFGVEELAEEVKICLSKVNS